MLSRWTICVCWAHAMYTQVSHMQEILFGIEKPCCYGDLNPYTFRSLCRNDNGHVIFGIRFKIVYPLVENYIINVRSNVRRNCNILRLQ